MTRALALVVNNVHMATNEHVARKLPEMHEQNAVPQAIWEYAWAREW